MAFFDLAMRDDADGHRQVLYVGGVARTGHDHFVEVDAAGNIGGVGCFWQRIPGGGLQEKAGGQEQGCGKYCTQVHLVLFLNGKNR